MVHEAGFALTAGWSSDSVAFFVNDQIASDSELAYIYDAGGTKQVDVRGRILAADPAASRFAAGHGYFHVLDWRDRKRVIVDFDGHTDQDPVACFEFRYLVRLNGTVQKISQRLLPVTSKACR